MNNTKMTTKTALVVDMARQLGITVTKLPIPSRLPAISQLLGTPQVWRPRVGPKATGKTQLFVDFGRQFGIPIKPAPVVVAPQVPTHAQLLGTPQVWRPRVGPKGTRKTDLVLRLLSSQ